MARRASIDDEELLGRLTAVFRDLGYAGASLSALSEATGLKRASLYHRFPGGKEEMARAILRRAEEWLGEHILKPLKSDQSPEARIRHMAKKLDECYGGGQEACLLNVLASQDIHAGPFSDHIQKSFEIWIAALADVLIDAGIQRKESKKRAERAIAMLQGSLVLSRGMGITRPFKNFLADLPESLLGTAP